MSFPSPPKGSKDLTGCIDLHMHTTFSDGEQTPEYLVEWASTLGLKAIAVTDHDSCNGVERATEAGHKFGVEVIPAVEISVALSKGTFHLLGYYVDHTDLKFTHRLQNTVDSRNIRNDKILDALNDAGMKVSLSELLELAGEAVIGRPHIAALLVKKGFVADRQEAFDKYIAEGKPCYFDKEDFSPADTIKLVRDAGGIPVLAHPIWANRGGLQATEDWLEPLIKQGLMGLECIYPDHDEEWTEGLQDICKRHNLVVTGGSDYHGPWVRPDIYLGSGRGDGFHVPADLLETLQNAHDVVRLEG